MSFRLAFEFQGISNTLYGYGEAPATGMPVGYTWVSALTQKPSLSSDAVDRFTGRMYGSRCPIEMNATPELRKLFLYKPGRRQSLGRLPVEMDAVTSSPTLVPGLSGTVWIGTETLELGTDTAGVYIGTTRGAFDSKEKTHPAGAHIWPAPPYWKQRRVRLWVWRDGVLYRRWQGHIARDPVAVSRASVIRIETESIWERLERVTVGHHLQAMQMTAGRIELWTDGVRKPNVASVIRAVRAGTDEPSLFHVKLDGQGARTMLTSTPLLDSYPINETSRTWEVMIVSRAVDAIAPVSPTINCPRPYHPLTIFAAHLFSTELPDENVDEFDVLHPGMSAGFRYATSTATLTTIRALIEETQELEVDRWVAKIDEDPVELYARLREMALSYGFVAVSTSSGDITFNRVRLADIGDADAPQYQLLSDTFDERPGPGSAIDTIEGVAGDLPWLAGSPLKVSINGIEEDFTPEGDSQTMHFPTHRAERAAEIAQIQIFNALMYRFESMVVIKCRVNGPGADLNLLDFFRLKMVRGLGADIIIDNDGTLTRDLEQERFIGQLISRRSLIDHADSFELEFACTNYGAGGLLKWRAPNAVVAVETTGTIIECEPDEYGNILLDAETLDDEHVIAIWTADLQRLVAAGVRTIQNVSGNQIEVDSAFAITLLPGYVIRLAQYIDYIVATRKHTFIAGDDLSKAEADLYG